MQPHKKNLRYDNQESKLFNIQNKKNFSGFSTWLNVYYLLHNVSREFFIRNLRAEKFFALLFNIVSDPIGILKIN